MNREEFIEKMGKTKRQVEELNYSCVALEYSFEYINVYKIKRCYYDICCPDKDSYSEHDVWFGPTSSNQVPIRLQALDKFEKVCLEKELYKEF